jgi:hypothetical protein
MNPDLLQKIGYFASVITASSMMMSSIVKFRWINLVGATIFMTYGFMIGALPVGLLNAFIVGTDIYYLIKIYSRQEQFKTLDVKPDNKYLFEFLAFHHENIQKFFPGFSYKPELNTVSFFVLRNMSVAGIFLAHREEGDVLKVGLDYVIPEYRDFKNGRYIYHRLAIYFEMAGYKKIIVESKSPKYGKYLQKMGFVKNEAGMFETKIVKTIIT